MNDKESTLDNLKLALSRAPLEMYASIIYDVCRVNISKIDGNLGQLANDNELTRASHKRLDVIEEIYSDLGEIRNILWIAVETSRLNNSTPNSTHEG